jgi:CRP/FNR family transcriptional regulator, cyclic AMP receptor protein
MADEALFTFLSGTPFFGGLTRPALERVEAMLVARSLPAGAAIFREGEPGCSMFIVKSGDLIVTAAGAPGDPPVRLRHLGAGDFFGEMTLIEMQPRSATVRAESDTELFELRARDLYEIYKHDIKAYVMVLQNINRELCRRLRTTSQRLVEWASSNEDESTQVGVQRISRD